MTKDFDKMTDDDHIRYMVSLGDRAVIKQLYETEDAWTFGGLSPPRIEATNSTGITGTQGPYRWRVLAGQL